MSEPIAFIDVGATEDLLLMGAKTKHKTLVVMQAGNLEPQPQKRKRITQIIKLGQSKRATFAARANRNEEA